jgi:hypothetical protein
VSNWIRLYITVEGRAEQEFVDKALRPHLASYAVDVRPRLVVTNRKKEKRGGILNFDDIKNDITRRMKEDTHPEARFTTMVDFYGLPPEFPGWNKAKSQPTPYGKVQVLQQALDDYFRAPRFFSFIQLHEFEALLYCDLRELQRRIINSEAGIKALKAEVGEMNPEEINEGASTAPSKRIIRHIPIYERNKVRVGAPAAAAIGLDTLRKKCPHFGAWIHKLEDLRNPTS